VHELLPLARSLWLRFVRMFLGVAPETENLQIFELHIKDVPVVHMMHLNAFLTPTPRALLAALVDLPAS